jgi:RNA polymerase sigma factor (sigma-70 family)
LSNYIQDIRQGNHRSFEIVFKLWHKKVYAYFLKKTASDDLAEELTQLAFIKLWRFKHTLTEDFPLDVQLFKIAKTTLLDYFKKLANDERNLKNYGADLTDKVDEQSLQFDINKQLEVVLNCLPPTRKQVFVLNRVHGYSYKEIAEQLSISPRTVEKHISLAIKQLNGYAYLPAFVFLIDLLAK